MKKLWLVAICSFVILSCAPPLALEYKTYYNFRVKNLGFNKSTVTLDLEYYNPNNYGMRLKNTELDIYINNNFLGHSSSDTIINIPKKASFILPVVFDVDMRNAFKNAYSTMTGKEVAIKLIGKIKAGKGNVFITFPVNYETREKFSFFQ